MTRSCPLIVLGILALAACVDQPADPTDLGTTTEALAYGNLSNALQVKRGALCMVAPVTGVGPVTQQPCQSTSTHWWKVVQSPVDPGFYYIENNDGSRRCLDVPSFAGSSSLVGLDLQVYPCHRLSSQLFALTRTAAGEWKVQPKLGAQSNLCLDIEGGGTNPGARLQQYACKTTDVDNQRFLAVPLQREPEYRDCDSDGFLRVHISGEPTTTMYQGDVWNLAYEFGLFYSCNQLPVVDRFGTHWQDAYDCPTGTNLIEINRNYVDRFRLKCGRR